MRLYVDANPIIYAFEGEPNLKAARGEASRWPAARLRAGPRPGFALALFSMSFLAVTERTSTVHRYDDANEDADARA